VSPCLQELRSKLNSGLPDLGRTVCFGDESESSTPPEEEYQVPVNSANETD